MTSIVTMVEKIVSSGYFMVFYNLNSDVAGHLYITVSTGRI